MRLSIGLIIILLLTVNAPAQETVPSEIKEVTLFFNQALVKREARAWVHEGLNEIWLEVDAFRVDRDSISARVFGEGEILSVQYREGVYLWELNLGPGGKREILMEFTITYPKDSPPTGI